MPHQLDRPLYLTEDRNEVVEEGDERARYVLGGEGSEIPDDEAERLGLKAAAGPSEDKNAQPAREDKAQEAPATEVPAEDAPQEDGDTSDEPDATGPARELAESEGVNLADVQGTGEGGRVLKSDVESVLSQRAAED